MTISLKGKVNIYKTLTIPVLVLLERDRTALDDFMKTDELANDLRRAADISGASRKQSPLT